MTLDEVLAAAAARAASLVPETSGYLVLAVGDASSRLPLSLDERAVVLTTEGSVSLTRRGEVVSPRIAARAVRDLLARLLGVSSGTMPGLASAARPRDESDRGVDGVIEEIEAALIPVNRAAARRALARLARETLRAKEAGKLRPRRPAPPRSAPPPAPIAPPIAAPIAAPPQIDAAPAAPPRPIEAPTRRALLTPPPMPAAVSAEQAMIAAGEPTVNPSPVATEPRIEHPPRVVITERPPPMPIERAEPMVAAPVATQVPPITVMTAIPVAPPTPVEPPVTMTIAEPPIAEPLIAEPRITEPLIAEPLIAEPLIAEPPIAEPSIAEPSIAEPPIAKPVIAEPLIAEPLIAEPLIAEPLIAEPSIAEPVIAEAAPVEAAEPAAIEAAPVDRFADLAEPTPTVLGMAIEIDDAQTPVDALLVQRIEQLPADEPALDAAPLAPLMPVHLTPRPEPAPLVVAAPIVAAPAPVEHNVVVKVLMDPIVDDWSPRLPSVAPPVVAAPIVEVPVVAALIVDVPAVAAPIVNAPVVAAPIVSAPVVAAPIANAPVVAAPASIPVVDAPPAALPAPVEPEPILAVQALIETPEPEEISLPIATPTPAAPPPTRPLLSGPRLAPSPEAQTRADLLLASFACSSGEDTMMTATVASLRSLAYAPTPPPPQARAVRAAAATSAFSTGLPGMDRLLPSTLPPSVEALSPPLTAIPTPRIAGRVRPSPASTVAANAETPATTDEETAPRAAAEAPKKGRSGLGLFAALFAGTLAGLATVAHLRPDLVASLEERIGPSLTGAPRSPAPPAPPPAH